MISCALRAHQNPYVDMHTSAIPLCHQQSMQLYSDPTSCQFLNHWVECWDQLLRQTPPETVLPDIQAISTTAVLLDVSQGWNLTFPCECSTAQPSHRDSHVREMLFYSCAWRSLCYSHAERKGIKVVYDLQVMFAASESQPTLVQEAQPIWVGYAANSFFCKP